MRIWNPGRWRHWALRGWGRCAEGAGTAGGAGQPAGSTAGKQDDVVEADYEIVDENKK